MSKNIHFGEIINIIEGDKFKNTLRGCLDFLNVGGSIANGYCCAIMPGTTVVAPVAWCN